MFPQLRFKAILRTLVNTLSDRPSTYTYGSNGILIKFDFSNDISRVFQSKGSQAAILHVRQTWPTPEVSSKISRFRKILTKISISMSSHLLVLEEYIFSIHLTGFWKSSKGLTTLRGLWNKRENDKDNEARESLKQN